MKHYLECFFSSKTKTKEVDRELKSLKICCSSILPLVKLVSESVQNF